MNSTTALIWIITVILLDGTIEYLEEKDRELAHQRALKEFSNNPNIRGITVDPCEQIRYH